MAACDVWRQTHKHFKNALVQESFKVGEETYPHQSNNLNSFLTDELPGSSKILMEIVLILMTMVMITDK